MGWNHAEFKDGTEEIATQANKAVNEGLKGVKKLAFKLFEDAKGKVDQFSPVDSTVVSSVSNSWASLTEGFSLFPAGNFGRQAAREFLTGTIAPPPRPELVEEAAVAALLEMQPRVQALIDKSPEARHILGRAEQQVVRTIAVVRSAATSEAIQALIAQDRYRSCVQKAIEDNWKSVKKDVIGNVQNEVEVQACLGQILKDQKQKDYSERDLKSQTKLTVMDSISRRQESLAKSSLTSMGRAGKDLTGVRAGAAGHGAELLQFVQKTDVHVGE